MVYESLSVFLILLFCPMVKNTQISVNITFYFIKRRLERIHHISVKNLDVLDNLTRVNYLIID